MLGLADAMTKQGWEVHFYVPQACKQLVEGVGAKWQPMGQQEELTIESAAVAAIKDKLGLDITADIPVNVLPFRVVPATLTVLPYLLRSVSRLSPRFLVFDACAPWGLILSQVLCVPAVSCMSALPTPASQRDEGSQNYSLGAQRVLDATSAALKAEYQVDFNHNHSYQLYAPYTLITSSRCWHRGHEEFARDQFHYWGALISERQGSANVSGCAEVDRLLSDENLGRNFNGQSGKPLFFCSLGTVTTGSAFGLFGSTVQDYYRKLLQAAALMPEVSFIFAVGKKAEIVEEGGDAGMPRIVELFERYVPDNVVVARAVDQPTLLARANGFLTHCGQNSSSEAILAGVPVVVAPFFGDQIQNALRFQELGCGLAQSFHPDLERVSGIQIPPASDLGLVTPESLANAMRRVLEEPQFAAAMQKLRAQEKDEVGAPVAEKLSSLVASMDLQSKSMQPRFEAFASPSHIGALGGM
jgi:UDP:flavonoid glycosyltransferase YjiC (YdhE family)